MSTNVIDDRELKDDVDLLRERFPKTQDLYREVCALLFFRYGIAPTANKLFQLVRKGSMSAPAEALTRFWEDLREKSRVRIEHPDLPEELKTAAAEMTMALWSSAQSLAQDSLVNLKQDAQAAVAEAEALKTKAGSDRDAAIQALEQSRQAHNDALQRISELEQLLASANTTVTLLGSQLQQAREDQISREEMLENSRREFGSELEKIRASAATAEARYQAAEKRALLDIDHERTNTAKLQKELAFARANFDQTVKQLGIETAALQRQINDGEHKAGVLEGKLKTVTTSFQQIEKDYRDVLDKLSKLQQLLLASQANSEKWKKEAKEASRRVEDQKKTVKQVRAKQPVHR